MIKLTEKPSASPFLTNLWVTQDRLGYSEWINYSATNDSNLAIMPLPMLEPLLLQNASINGCNELSQKLVKPIIDVFSNLPVEKFSFKHQSCLGINIAEPKKLRIAWLSADICHHPVARFLLILLFCFYSNIASVLILTIMVLNLFVTF